MTQEPIVYRPSRLVRWVILPGGLTLSAFSIAMGLWAATYLPTWAALPLGVIALALLGVGLASLIMAGQLVLLRGPTLIMDVAGVNVAAYSTGPIQWNHVAGVDIVDGSAGGIRFRTTPEARLSRLAKFLIAMNGGRGGIVIADSYLNAEAEAVMEAAQRLRAESPS